MHVSGKQCALYIALIGFGAFCNNWRIQAQDTDKYLHPAIVRSLDDGWVDYQWIALHNIRAQFHECKRTVSCYSNFMEYDLTKDEKNHLVHFELDLQTASPSSFRMVPGRSAPIPDSDSTLYEDLNGDSVFDRMTKQGPQGRSSYILYKNAWVPVNYLMGKRDRNHASFGKMYSSIPNNDRPHLVDDRIHYIFKDGQWEIESQPEAPNK
jgi:hypothetical protein